MTEQAAAPVVAETPTADAGASTNLSGFMTPDAPTGEPTPELKSLVPNDYQDKGWYGDMKDNPADFFKHYDEMQSSFGSRVKLPDADSTPEEWGKFHDKMGRPESADKYNYGEVPEGVEINAEMQGKFGELAYELGLSDTQAQKLMEFDVQRAQSQAEKADTNLGDEAFDKMANDAFGDNRESIIKNASEQLNKFAPEGFADHVAGLDNKSLIVMASVLDQMSKSTGEDNMPNGAEGHTGALSEAEIRGQASALMAKPEYRDKFHPNHKATADKVNELYGRLGKM